MNQNQKASDADAGEARRGPAAVGLALTPNDATRPSVFDPEDEDNLRREPAAPSTVAEVLGGIDLWPPFEAGKEANDDRHVPLSAVLHTGDVIERLDHDVYGADTYSVVVGGSHENVVLWSPLDAYQHQHVEGIVSDAGWGEIAVHRNLIQHVE
ncbi:MAG: hypothetical protein ACI9CA_002266 [Natronomonas sp.]|jgi:hypothetical protein